LENLKDAWERHKRGHPLVLISNHLSYIDSHIIEEMLISNGLGEMARRLFHLAGQKTYSTIWRRFFTRGVNTIKVFQWGIKAPAGTKKRRAMQSFRAFKRVVTTNPVLLFPEGTRTRTGRMSPGVPVLVNYLRGNLVLPIALQGTEKMLAVGARLPRRIRVVLKVGKAFIAKASPQISKEREMAGYLSRVAELLDPAYRPSDPVPQAEGG
jgi:1-acyl-sn-glycerol-3-phosphate acyltransferase